MRKFFIGVVSLVLVACGTAVPSVKPYKLDVQQGNVVTSKMLLQLRPGMSKSQVRYIMGTPLIQDSFHGNRWDYFYQLREGGKVVEQRRVILDFENEQLKSVRGDVIPSEGSSGKSDGVTGTRVVEPEAAAKEKGLWDKLKFWQKDEAELAKEAEEAKLAEQKKADEAAKKAEKVAPEANQSVPVLPSEPSPVVEEKLAPAEDKVIEKPIEKPAVKEVPVEEKSASAASKDKESAEQEEGWLDKLKFWGDDKPKAEDAKAKATADQKAAEETEKKGWLDKLKFWKSDEPDTKSTEPVPAATEDVKSLSGVPIIELPEADKK